MSRPQSTATMHPLHLGTSSAQRAVCVHIAWSDAAIIRSTANRDAALAVHTVDVRPGSLSILESVKLDVKAGTVLYFVKSNHVGWYYLVSYAATAFRCSCPEHTACEHQREVMAYVTRRCQIIERIEEAVTPEEAERLVTQATEATLLKVPVTA